MQSISLFLINELIPNQSILNQSIEKKNRIVNCTFTPDNTGRLVVVELPIKNSLKHLGNSLVFVIKRLYSLECKFKNFPEL